MPRVRADNDARYALRASFVDENGDILDTPVVIPAGVSGITATQISNWDTAYSWGDHSTQGYLTSFTETDPVFAASDASGISSSDISNWDTAYGWGDHSTGGYLTSFTETDPVFAASDASGISSSDITNWDTAYGWGDHSTEGYWVDGSSSLNATSSIKCGTDGSSPVGFTVNDGGGNANIVFNHFNNAVTTAGANTARIVHNSDGTTASNLSFRTGTAGVAPSERLRIDDLGIDVTGAFTATGTLSASGYNSANWDTAYGWGDHSTQGYLTSFTETDPVFAASAANGISSSDITNWDTAYGWGNHASAGYAPSSGAITLSTNGTDFVVRDTTQTTHNFIWRDHSAGKLYLGTNDDDVTIRGSSGLGWESTNANQIYFSFVGGAAKRLTTQGGLVLGIDSSVILHAGDNVNSLKGTYGITDATTAETMYVTADGEVNIEAGHQTSGGSTAWRWQFQSDGNLQLPKAAGVSNTSHTWMKATPQGQYGSIEIDGGATGGWEGYSIGGRAVFMHDNNTVTGLYNDVNNQWILKGTHNGRTDLMYAGSTKGYTYSSGWRVTGNLLATSDVYAYYSDRRLKDVVGAIEKPLESIGAIETFYYTHNDKARELGYEGSERQVGVSAQSVKAVLPEVIGRAPIDDDGEGGSVTGEDYMTVKYERIVPLLIEGIKELTAELESVKTELRELKDKSDAI